MMKLSGSLFEAGIGGWFFYENFEVLYGNLTDSGIVISWLIFVIVLRVSMQFAIQKKQDVKNESLEGQPC